MHQSSIFQWREALGWLVLSGGGDYLKGETEAIDARMLTRGAADGPLVYINAADPDLEAAEQYLTYLDDLGGRSGYIIDIISEDDVTLKTKLGEAGVIIIGDGPDRSRLFNSLHGAAIEGIEQAFEQGALIMGIGIGATVFGEWVLSLDSDNTADGFSWLTRAAIIGGTPSPEEKLKLKALLHSNPIAYGLGIWAGSALTLGPAGNVELWGNQQISISLGKAYTVHDDQ